MRIGRRGVLRLFASVGIGVVGGGAWWRQSALAQFPRLALRKVGEHDAPDLQAIMNACVADADSFHGKCNSWSRAWADRTVRRRPETIVLTRDGMPAAFFELASIRRLPEPPVAEPGSDEWRKFELRERNARTFRLSAAGVRADVLSPEESVQMFRRVLYYGASAARKLGYEYIECLAPWDRHPKMPMRWTEYRGCELVEPVALNQADGRDIYWLRWAIDDMIAALAAEGAGEEQLDAL